MEFKEERPERQVKSFVRRQGRMTESQKRAIEGCWEKWAIELLSGTMLLTDIFPDQKPVVLEIGFGMGDTLAQMAGDNRDINYIGAEVHRPGVGNLFKLIEQNQLTNVRVLNDDVNILLDKIPDHSLSGVLLYFPDPWPKKRHHKRRIVQPSWVSSIAKKLMPGGYLHMATDWEPYAQWMLEVMESSDDYVNRAGKGQFHPRPESRPLTKFEQRGLRLGHGVWDLIYEYRPGVNIV